MIKYLKKDITTIEKGVMVHGCNCSGGFGSGVAKAIRSKWPALYDLFKTVKNPDVGQAYSMRINDLILINGYTQRNYGYDGRVYADKRAVKKVVEYAVNLAIKNDMDVYMPKIGCGLGGLSWPDDVYPLLNEINTKGRTIYVCVL